jgi:Tat protein secretion system quality control protein TatD with DNase activity
LSEKENFKAAHFGIVQLKRSLNMKLVDAHIHFSDPEYVGHTDTIGADAKTSGVAALVSNARDYQTIIVSLRLATKYPELVYVSLAFTPRMLITSRKPSSKIRLILFLSKPKTNPLPP